MRLVTVGLLLLALATTSACSNDPESIAETTYQGLPPGATGGGPDSDPLATWIEVGSVVAITTFGSSSCPALPIDLTVSGDVVTVRMDSDYEGDCTADLAPSTSEVELPDVTDTPTSLRLEFVGFSAIEVPIG